MPVEDVFSIEGRGTVATGRVERGIIKKMEEVEIIGIKRHPERPRSPTSKCSVSLLDEGRAGDNVGLLVRGRQEGGDRAWSVLSPSRDR